MKKIAFLLCGFMATVSFCGIVYASANPVKLGHVKPEGPVNEVTLEMLNCKPGFYKTYQDFVNQTPKNWTYKTLGYGTLGNTLKQYNIIFLDESGKKVLIPTSDFWGWKAKNGELCRNIPVAYGKVSAIAAIVRFTTKDFVCYGLPLGCDMSTPPNEWYSIGLNGDVVDKNAFFNSHSGAEALSKKIIGEGQYCEKPHKRYKSMDDFDKACYACFDQIQGLTGYFVYFGEVQPGIYVK